MVNCIKEREGSGLKPPKNRENQKGRLTKDGNPTRKPSNTWTLNKGERKKEKRNL